eukprot:353209-Chlamydomonas_euryale.AAC.4
MIDLKIACDGGKDSLSMAAAAGGEVVMAPGNLVVSAYVSCPDITKVCGCGCVGGAPRCSRSRRAVPAPAALLPPAAALFPVPPRCSCSRRAVPAPAALFLLPPRCSCSRRAVHAGAALCMLLPPGGDSRLEAG